MSDRILTTTDNKYDPFTEFDRWYALDMQLSELYQRPNCFQYVNRIMKTNPSMSEEEKEQAYNSALDEIIRYNLTGVYKIVEKKTNEGE